MKASKFSESQIAFVLRQSEAGTSVEEICRKTGSARLEQIPPDLDQAR